MSNARSKEWRNINVTERTPPQTHRSARAARGDSSDGRHLSSSLLPLNRGATTENMLQIRKPLHPFMQRGERRGAETEFDTAHGACPHLCCCCSERRRASSLCFFASSSCGLLAGLQYASERAQQD